MKSNPVAKKPWRYAGYPKKTVRLYLAEGRVLPKKLKGEDRARPQMTLAECQNYVDSVLTSSYVRTRYSFNKRIRVTDGRGFEAGAALFSKDGKPVIHLPRFTRNKHYILHEITHHLVGINEAHNAIFTTALLRLVKAQMGHSAYSKLKSAYLEKGVEFAGRR